MFSKNELLGLTKIRQGFYCIDLLIVARIVLVKLCLAQGDKSMIIRDLNALTRRELSYNFMIIQHNGHRFKVSLKRQTYGYKVSYMQSNAAGSYALVGTIEDAKFIIRNWRLVLNGQIKNSVRYHINLKRSLVFK